MRNVMTTDTESSNNIRGFSEEELGREDRNAELNWKELESVAGGRITNIRINAQPIMGGSAAGGSAS